MKSSHLKRLSGIAALLILGGLACVQAENTTAVDEILKLKDAGVSEETIVTYIQSKDINYGLSADDILALHAKGVSPAVLNAMVASGTSGASGSSPAAAGQGAAPAAAPAATTYPGQVPDAPTAPPAQTISTPPLTAPVALTPTTSPDVAYFYQELSPYGRWVMAEDGQWYWQPNVAMSNPDWRPYWNNGHWVYTDSGWYWSSDYPWGWAAFHYGRWQLHPHFGWIWLPDRVWGPGWVVWRSGGDYCGWAPLPPGAVFDVASGRFLFRGQRVAASFDFGLGWMNFNFTHVRDLGGPLHWHPGRESEYRDIFNRTKLIGGYHVGNSIIHGESRAHFMNGGIELKHVEKLRGHSLETMHVRDLNVHVGRNVYERVDDKSKTLETYRPRFDHHDNRGGNGNGRGRSR